MKPIPTFAALGVALGLSACASLGATPMPGGAETAEGVLTNDAGMTLHTFAKGASGKSVCPCAGNWPPLAAAADARDTGDWTVIARDDGSRQWAHRGKPLYAWSKDQKAGDGSGDGFLDGAWQVARP